MENKNKTRVNWSREEIILALDLYHRITFEKIRSNNSEIIELAKLLGRTTGAVKAKMYNLAHFDQELQKKNIDSIGHASKLDGEIVAEFSNDWENLSYQAQQIRKKINKQI